MNIDKKMITQKRNHIMAHLKVILSVLIIGTLLAGCGGKKDTYNSANQALENGNYTLALELFEKCKGFQDSDEKIIEATYGKASELLEAGSYAEAKNLFESIQQYSDTKDQILKCDYEYANALLREGDYYQAIDLFTELDGFLDSPNMVMECKYEIACEQLENEILDVARENFEALGDYKDSVEKLKEIDYQTACIYMESEEYEIARSMLVTLGDYKDSQMYIQAIDCAPYAKKVGLAIQSELLTMSVLGGWEVDCEYSPSTYTFTTKYTITTSGLWGGLYSLGHALTGESEEYPEENMRDQAKSIYDKYFKPAGYTQISCTVIMDDRATEAYGEGTYIPEGYITSADVSVNPSENHGGGDIDYILPTDTQYIEPAVLQQLNQEEVVLARNEIYARHGYSFQSENIRTYFEGKSWYHADPNVNASTFGTAQMSDVERTNLETIQQYERDMGWK